ncbi:MAG: hypothetical protein FD167_5548 [bacterium]|nr:MAG: hypothetical protein FD167_5548 [bacterium]
MNNSVQLSKEALAAMAVEVWRLGQNLVKLPSQPNFVALKYSIRKLRQTLEEQSCVFLDLTGKIYDAGLALEVIDIEDDKKDDKKDESNKNNLIIKETIVPIILFQNKLLVSGQVILGKLNFEENA